MISNFGYQKFIKVSSDAQISIDKEKLIKAAAWDGLHGVFTNIKDLSAEEILEQYHGLWQVEESFRIHKHDLMVRPIFHWTPKRIKAHIAIVYMAFSLIRFMQVKLRQNGIKMSAEQVRNELVHAQTSILKHKLSGEFYAIPSKPSKKIKEIYAVFN